MQRRARAYRQFGAVKQSRAKSVVQLSVAGPRAPTSGGCSLSVSARVQEFTMSNKTWDRR
jgi:hypothetical protein